MTNRSTIEKFAWWKINKRKSSQWTESPQMERHFHGEFPNVPLLGIRGGITYNPCLALRQFGYARRDGPHNMLIPALVFDFDNNAQGLRQSSSELGGCPTRWIVRHWGTRIPSPLILTSSGYEPAPRVLWCLTPKFWINFGADVSWPLLWSFA